MNNGIRTNFFSKLKLKGYFSYAIGEVVLIFIGVYCATLFGEWRQDVEDKATLRHQLTSMKFELKYDSTVFKRFYLDRFQKKMHGLNLLKQYIAGDYHIDDTSKFIQETSYGAIANYWQYLNRESFNAMSNSGYLKLIKNDSLREDILSYYNREKVVHEYSSIAESGYQRAINSLRWFHADNPDSVSAFDRRFFLLHVKSNEMIKHINLELVHGDYIHARTESYMESCTDIIKRIDDYLRRN